MKKFSILAFVFLTHFCIAQDSLRTRIEQIAKSAKGIVGVSIMNIETGDTLTLNGKAHLPMQSVFKFPIAMAILNKVDSGKLSLDKKIHLKKEDMIPKTWSPLRDKYPNGNVDISIRDLLSYVVSQSDNVACDVLLEVLGGPKYVENYMHSLGIKGIAIEFTEAQMHSAWDIQYKNWCEPNEMMHLLNGFYAGKYLSKSSTTLLVKIMEETVTSPKRLKGLLPEGTTVAHKSGTSGTNTDSVAAATNDVGIITLPNGKHIIMAAFVSDAKANDASRDLVIAKIARAVYDCVLRNKPLR
ncbi:MAG TPA: class A beta-lactamase, subclass A2 [Bacteroidia bacterium]|nr:class A beta-lactamase, subclass A2 [Bacteroidia bacterium]